MCYIIKNIQIYVILLRFYAFFRLFYSILGALRTEKYHKIAKNTEKQVWFGGAFSGGGGSWVQVRVRGWERDAGAVTDYTLLIYGGNPILRQRPRR